MREAVRCCGYGREGFVRGRERRGKGEGQEEAERGREGRGRDWQP